VIELPVVGRKVELPPLHPGQHPKVRWVFRLLHRHAPFLWLLVFAVPVAVLFTLDAAVSSVGDGLDNWALEHEVGAALLSHALVAAAVAPVAIYWVLGRKRQKALRRYRRNACDEPAELVEWSRGETPIVRLGTCRRLADAIRRSGEKPAVVVIQGRPGTGRTSCVVGLVQELAKHKMIPIPVLAKRDGSFDLEELACEKFCKHVDRVVSSGEQADAIWHRARSTNDIVVLVDGLDDEIIGKLSRDRGRRFQKTIKDLLSSEIAVVLATTGDLPLGDMTIVREDLHHLNREETTDYLRNTLDDADRKDAWDALERLQEPIDGFLVAPFYVDLVVRLQKAGISLEELPQQMDQWRARVLKDYLDAIQNNKIEFGSAEGEEREQRGRAALHAAEEVAKRLKIGDADRISVARTSLKADDLALSDAEDLNLLWSGDESVGFASEDLGAYLVARRRQDPSQLLDDVRLVAKSKNQRKRRDRYVRTTLIFWHLEHEEARRATFKTFLEELDNCRNRPLLAVAAIRIVCACGLTAFAGRVATAAEECVKQFDNPQKRIAQEWRAHELLGLVRALATWPHPGAHLLLWRLATNQNLEIEWWAAKALALSEGEPTRVLKPEMDKALSAAVKKKRISRATNRRGQKVASLAWILPALRDSPISVEEELSKLRDVCLEDRMSPVRGQMALAQGLKLAILNRRQVDKNVELVRELLFERNGDVRFWHVRLVLVQALLAYAWEHPHEADTIRVELDGLFWNESHQLVKKGIEFALCALLDLKQVPDGTSSTLSKYMYMWSHERDAVRWVEVGRDALAQLAADVVLLSNMTYRLWEHDTKWAWETAVWPELPPCISKSSRREGIDRDCKHECGFGLCREGSEKAVLAGRAQFSASFCRDQARLIRQNGTPSWVRRAARRKRDLKKFWDKQANLVQSQSR
jgi:hypothetical protein